MTWVFQIHGGKVEEEEPDWTWPNLEDPNVGIVKDLHNLNGQSGGKEQRRSGWHKQGGLWQTKFPTARRNCGLLHCLKLSTKIKITWMASSKSVWFRFLPLFSQSNGNDPAVDGVRLGHLDPSHSTPTIGKLASGKRLRGGPKRRYKAKLKTSLTQADIDAETREILAASRPSCCGIIRATETFECNREIGWAFWCSNASKCRRYSGL